MFAIKATEFHVHIPLAPSNSNLAEMYRQNELLSSLCFIFIEGIIMFRRLGALLEVFIGPV